MATKKTLTPRRPGMGEAVVGMEPLEGRQLLSGGGHHHGGGGLGGHGGSTITFDQAPTAVQNGLTTLAGTDNVAAPTSTTAVHLANRGGLETYTVDITGTGTDTRLTVDQNGVAVSDPTHNTTTYADLQTTDATAANELATIATAENLTAPAGTDTVGINVSSGGLTTYSIRLTSASTSTTGRHGPRGALVTVDAAGNPSGNEVVPFSTLPTAIQDGLNNAAPAGATALTDTSNVLVRIADGVELYSATFSGTGTRTTVTVDNTGTLTSLPSRKKITFADVPAAAQTELQSLATAKGFSGTIAGTQTVYEYDEANGNVVYSVSVKATGTRNNGNTFTFMVTVSSDANGNPTTPPDDGGGFGGGGFGGGDDRGGFFGNFRRRRH